jgi:antitoxin MazE
MKTQVIRSDGKTAVVIPEELAIAATLPDEVYVEMRGRDIVISADRKLTLAEMVATITPENRHEETDWGPAVGKEIW